MEWGWPCHGRGSLGTPPPLPTSLPVNGAVAVEHLAVVAGLRHADAVLVARHRREIADAQGETAAIPGEAGEGDHALDGIATVHPGEAVRLAVALVERRFGPVHAIQVGHQALEAAMVGPHIEEMPVEAAVVVPFRGLAELAPMKSSFFPGYAHMNA